MLFCAISDLCALRTGKDEFHAMEGNSLGMTAREKQFKLLAFVLMLTG